ncbi:MAG: NUDIX domain-containing protein [Cytophagaceae bacterium]
MEKLTKEIEKVFGNKLRVRVSGICSIDDEILLVNHHSLGEMGTLWAPPGGGIDFGESAEDTLIREFKEETGLNIEVTRFLFIHEFIQMPLHAIELFFEVKIVDGKLQKGLDPEMKKELQIINEVRFLEYTSIKNQDPKLYHNILNHCITLTDLLNTRGYIKFTA